MADTPDIDALIARMNTFLGTFPKGTTLYSLHPAVMVREARDALEAQQAVVGAATRWQNNPNNVNRLALYHALSALDAPPEDKKP